MREETRAANASAPHKAQAADLRRISATSAICLRPPARIPVWIYDSLPGSKAGPTPPRAQYYSDILGSARIGWTIKASRTALFPPGKLGRSWRSEEHTSELQS